MQKDFDRWNGKKKRLDGIANPLKFHEREIWWCAIGVNVGSEQHSQTADFSRPVVIVRIWESNLFLGIPLTTKIRDIPDRFLFSLNGVENDALMNQVRTFDSRRLIRRIGTLGNDEFLALTLLMHERIGDTISEYLLLDAAEPRKKLG